MDRKELPPLNDATTANRLQALAATLIEGRKLRMETVSKSGWIALPRESASHFDEEYARQLSDAFGRLGERDCCAVVAETLKAFPSCFRFPATPEGFLDFSWTCGHFNFILFPESVRCAVLCTTDDYFVLAGPESFVEAASGGDIGSARKAFQEYARGDHRLLKVASFYSSTRSS